MKALRFAVIGDPVGHSLSPAMQNAALKAAGVNGTYEAVHVRREELRDFFERARNEYDGINVTVPHKQGTFELAEERTERACLCGSVNTVTIRNGRIAGDTTDGIGLERAVREGLDLELKGLDICFIGCGGVVPPLVFHCAACGARSVRILNRTVAKAEHLAEEAAAKFPSLRIDVSPLDDREKVSGFLKESGLAVQCTSLGLRDDDPSPVDPALLPEGIRVFDTIYRKTAFLQGAVSRKIRACGGLGMLLFQGAESFRIWTGIEPDLSAMRKALVQAAKERGNIG